MVQVFGQFLEEKYNPGGINTRPLNALGRVAADGFRQVIDIPYEFPGAAWTSWSDCVRPMALTYRVGDENFRIERDGISIKICSALFHPECRVNAYFERACQAVDRCLGQVSHLRSGRK